MKLLLVLAAVIAANAHAMPWPEPLPFPGALPAALPAPVPAAVPTQDGNPSDANPTGTGSGGASGNQPSGGASGDQPSGGAPTATGPEDDNLKELIDNAYALKNERPPQGSQVPQELESPVIQTKTLGDDDDDTEEKGFYGNSYYPSYDSGYGGYYGYPRRNNRFNYNLGTSSTAYGFGGSGGDPRNNFNYLMGTNTNSYGSGFGPGNYRGSYNNYGSSSYYSPYSRYGRYGRYNSGPRISASVSGSVSGSFSNGRRRNSYFHW